MALALPTSNVLPKVDLVHPCVADFLRHGLHELGQALSPESAREVLRDVCAVRHFGPDMFLSEAEFLADPVFRSVNPRPGRNLLERFPDHARLVETNEKIVAALEAMLGGGWRVMDRKFVCGVPHAWMPDWLVRRIAGDPVNNLGPYVRPQWRDVTYFYGIDFHQDLIDHPARAADFLTLYVYLDDVGLDDAPLHIMPGTHSLGGDVFPHQVDRTDHGDWIYSDHRGQRMRTQVRVLTGPAGSASMWHACTLHGTKPTVNDRARVSLRYLVARGDGAFAGIDLVNAALRGPLCLDDTRRDLDAAGAARVKNNTVLQA